MKDKKFLKFCIMLLLFIFACSYFVETSGYYEYNLSHKRNLTERQIREFENDVKMGKDIDINSYLEETSVDYSNKLTKVTTDINLKLNRYLKNIIKSSLKVFEKFVS